MATATVQDGMEQCSEPSETDNDDNDSNESQQEETETQQRNNELSLSDSTRVAVPLQHAEATKKTIYSVSPPDDDHQVNLSSKEARESAACSNSLHDDEKGINGTLRFVSY